MTSQELAVILQKIRPIPSAISPGADTGAVIDQALSQAPLPRTSPINQQSQMPSMDQLDDAAATAPLPQVPTPDKLVNLPIQPRTSLDPNSRDARIKQLEDIIMSKMTQREPWWQAGLSGVAMGAGARTPEEGSLMVARGMQNQQRQRQQEMVDQISAIKAMQEGKYQDEVSSVRRTQGQLVPYITDEGETIMVPQSGIPGLIRGQEANRRAVEVSKIAGNRPATARGSNDNISAADAQYMAASAGKKFIGPTGEEIDVSQLPPHMGLRMLSGFKIGEPERWTIMTQPTRDVTQNNVRSTIPAYSPMSPIVQGAANVGTASSREVQAVDKEGNPIAMPLQSQTRPATTGPIGQTMPAAGQVAPPPPVNPGVAQPVPGVAPPQPKIAPPGVVGGARQLPGFQEAELRRQTQVVKPIKAAASQLFGDKNVPDFESLTSFAHLADDPESRKRVGTAARLIMQTIDSAEKSGDGIGATIMGYGLHTNTGGILTGIRNELGVSKWLAQTEVDKIEDAMKALTPEESRALNRIMSAYGTIAGLRSITNGSALKFSMDSMNRELPIPGISGVTSSAAYYDKLAALASEITSAIDGSAISSQLLPEKSEYAAKARALTRLGQGQSSTPSTNPFKQPQANNPFRKPK